MKQAENKIIPITSITFNIFVTIPPHSRLGGGL